MSFMNKNFSVMAYANGFTLWNYSTSDTLATIKGANYFNDTAPFVRAGDMILAVTNNAAAPAGSILVITNLANSVVTVGALTA